jgi:hypothetical protein
MKAKFTEQEVDEFAYCGVYSARDTGLFGISFQDGKLVVGYNKGAEVGIVIDDRDERKVLKVWYGDDESTDCTFEEARQMLFQFIWDFECDGEVTIHDR